MSEVKLFPGSHDEDFESYKERLIKSSLDGVRARQPSTPNPNEKHRELQEFAAGAVVDAIVGMRVYAHWNNIQEDGVGITKVIPSAASTAREQLGIKFIQEGYDVFRGAVLLRELETVIAPTVFGMFWADQQIEGEDLWQNQ